MATKISRYPSRCHAILCSICPFSHVLSTARIGAFHLSTRRLPLKVSLRQCIRLSHPGWFATPGAIALVKPTARKHTRPSSAHASFIPWVSPPRRPPSRLRANLEPPVGGPEPRTAQLVPQNVPSPSNLLQERRQGCKNHHRCSRPTTSFVRIGHKPDYSQRSANDCQHVPKMDKDPACSSSHADT